MLSTFQSGDDVQTNDESGLRAAGVAVGLLLAGMAANIGVGIVTIIAFGVESIQSGGTGFLVSAIGGQGLVLVVALGYVLWRALDVPVEIPSLDESLVIGGSVIASIVAAIGLTYLREWLVPTQTSSGLAEMILANPSLALVVGALSVVLIAPAEELLFRGAIQGRLGQAFDGPAAVVGSSVLFGAWHLLNFTGSVIGAVLAAGVIGAVSLLWGYAYERTGNFAVPVLTHGLYNLTLMLIAYGSL